MHHQRRACEPIARASIDAGQQDRYVGTHQPGLDEHPDEQAGVQHDHGRVVLPAELAAAVLEAPGGVALGDHQLGQPLDTDEGDEDREEREARHRSSGARSSTSSEQKPGPIAISSP